MLDAKQTIYKKRRSLIETIDYLKDRYRAEQARFEHLESRCSKLLSFLTIVIAALGSVAVIKSDSIFEPSIPIEWIKLIAFFIALFAAVCAWGHSLLALKMLDCPVLQKNGDAAKYLEMTDIVSRDQHIIKAYVDTTEKLSEVVKEKSKYIELAYEELTMCAWFLGIVAAIAIGIEILN